MSESMDDTREADSPTPATEARVTAGACDLPVAPWQQGWTGRHTLIAAVATVAGWFFFSALAVSLSGIGWRAVVGYLSLATGLTVASYLPRTGRRFRIPRDVCSFSPLLLLLVSGWFLTIATDSIWSAAAPLVIAAAAVLRRTTTSSSCSA